MLVVTVRICVTVGNRAGNAKCFQLSGPAISVKHKLACVSHNTHTKVAFCLGLFTPPCKEVIVPHILEHLQTHDIGQCTAAMATPLEPSMSLLQLPGEILRNIVCLVLSPRIIHITVESAKYSIVTAKPEFQLSLTFVCKALREFAYDGFDAGLVLWLDSPIAMLHLDILPELIRKRVKYFDIRWDSYRHSMMDAYRLFKEPEGEMLIRETLLSFPSLETIHLDTAQDHLYGFEVANGMRELKADLCQHGDRQMRRFLEERKGIHLDQLNRGDRAIQVHISILTSSFYDGHNETEYIFASNPLDELSR